jgi:hypothetical protein
LLFRETSAGPRSNRDALSTSGLRWRAEESSASIEPSQYLTDPDLEVRTLRGGGPIKALCEQIANRNGIALDAQTQVRGASARGDTVSQRREGRVRHTAIAPSVAVFVEGVERACTSGPRGPAKLSRFAV